MTQNQDLRNLWQKTKLPENLEQAEINMEYTRFVVKDDVNKMMTFLSMEKFEKVIMELNLNLRGKLIKDNTAEEVEKRYVKLVTVDENQSTVLQEIKDNKIDLFKALTANSKKMKVKEKSLEIIKQVFLQLKMNQNTISALVEKIGTCSNILFKTPAFDETFFSLLRTKSEAV
uniref:Uncharacterized protein n=1 Tax=Strongyloides stercoralis TaxID=6248 RepID=A0A0K0DU33_STRER